MALVGAVPSIGPGKKGRREGPQPHPKAYPRRRAGFWAPAFASSKPGSPHCPAHPPGPPLLGGIRHGVGQLAKAERLEGLATPHPEKHRHTGIHAHMHAHVMNSPRLKNQAERD